MLPHMGTLQKCLQKQTVCLNGVGNQICKMLAFKMTGQHGSRCLRCHRQAPRSVMATIYESIIEIPTKQTAYQTTEAVGGN